MTDGCGSGTGATRVTCCPVKKIIFRWGCCFRVELCLERKEKEMVKLELVGNVPKRFVWNGVDLQAEIEFYQITQADLARFFMVKPDTVFNWLTGKTEVPYSACLCLTLLSMYPPVWVRNRLTGVVNMQRMHAHSYRQQEHLNEGSTEYREIKDRRADLRGPKRKVGRPRLP